ncbi:hypothetical protein H0H87_010915, partial [Tephrocybe sp. NHM501043]
MFSLTSLFPPPSTPTPEYTQARNRAMRLRWEADEAQIQWHRKAQAAIIAERRVLFWERTVMGLGGKGGLCETNVMEVLQPKDMVRRDGTTVVDELIN